MIKINRPGSIPRILQTKGKQENLKNCNLYLQYKDSYDNGKKKFEISRAIYGSATVKSLLEAAHHKKCCYCESIFNATSYGAVEHFRPKGAAKQEKQKKAYYPGYYWLAYDWNNLLFICERCNTNKGYCFPLEDDSRRAKNHTQPLATESPLFINPVLDDPSIHVRFHKDAMVGLTEKGKTTIEYIQLNRTGLFERRKKVFDIFQTLVSSAQMLCKDQGYQHHYKEVLNLIGEYLSVSSEYSAMTNAYFKQFSHLPEFSRIQG